MRNVLVRLSVAILMELVLAMVSAPFYMQIFPLILFMWVIYDITVHTKIIKIQTPINIPDDLKKQLEKHAKKQIKDLEKKLRTKNDIKAGEEEKE